MTGVAREELAALLRDLRGGGSFATRRTAPADGLVIDVKGVGPLKLPVPAAQAKALRLIARPAKYGRCEETILDRRVRDTWELPRSRVRIDQRRWKSTVRPVLDLIRDDLGLPESSTLMAELHSMLVYEPGQFFAPHQDSEKNDEMIGSLVVMLPSRSSGGDLVIGHRNESVSYSGSSTALTFVAFYADSRHEVLPVESGYRVVLTYNLLLGGSTSADPTHRGQAQSGAVFDLVLQHFAQAPAPRWHNDRQALEPPDRLVVLLDHQYTERGLQWSQLKGDDAARVEALRAGAELADCEIALAHAEVHETRECYDDAPSRWGKRGWSDWDEEPSGAGPERFEVGEVLDSGVTITPAAGEAHRFESDVDTAELAEITPTAELSPHDSEYTGYMGNWGNTMDRWYRRAAVVIWPRSRAFAISAKADPSGALDQLLAAPSSDDQSRADRAQRVETLLRFWSDAVSGDPGPLGPRALRLAWEINEAGLATRLLEPFTVETLEPSDATVLVALVEQHGIEWLQQLLSPWFTLQRTWDGMPASTRVGWVALLPDVCVALRDDPHGPPGLGAEIARAFLARTADWLVGAVRLAAGIAAPSQREIALDSLAIPVLAVLRSAFALDDEARRDQVIDTLTNPTLSVNDMLVDIVRAATPLPASERYGAGIGVIAARCRVELETELARPPRPPDDWSITGFRPGDCCADCVTLAEFLADASSQTVTWPLAKPRRQHIHRRIDEVELPVTHTTIRQGSPHKLVLTKTDDLHLQAACRRLAVEEAVAEIRTFLDDPA